MIQQRPIVVDALKGAAAGAIATWAMGQVTTYMYEKEDRTARKREDAARGNKTAYDIAAEKAAAVAGKKLTKKQRERYGLAIHWALGIGAGALYGALRPRSESASLAGGLLFGAGFWLLMDEAVTPALGLTKGPGAFPWQTHARGLAGHLVFGAVTDQALSVVQPSA